MKREKPKPSGKQPSGSKSSGKAPPRDGPSRGGVGKRITFDAATWAAIDLYARDSMKSFQELADEAFADLLTKHERPTSLKEALRASTRRIGANDNPRRSRGR